MYIMAAAYKTLDEEDKAAKKREESLQHRIKKKLVEDLPRITSGFAHWWKQKWSPSNFVSVKDSTGLNDSFHKNVPDRTLL